MTMLGYETDSSWMNIMDCYADLFLCFRFLKCFFYICFHMNQNDADIAEIFYIFLYICACHVSHSAPLPSNFRSRSHSDLPITYSKA